jgi:hypothetical protein
MVLQMRTTLNMLRGLALAVTAHERAFLSPSRIGVLVMEHPFPMAGL